MFSWVLGQLPPKKISPIPKTNPKRNPNPRTLTGGQFPRWQFPKPNHNLSRVQT